VIPLCANCHRLAHTQEPPLPIDDLRKRNKSGLHALRNRSVQRVAGGLDVS
jgi:hypothetical protein